MAKPKYTVGKENKKIQNYKQIMRRGLNNKVAMEKAKQNGGRGLKPTGVC